MQLKCYLEHENITEKLIENGADVNIVDVLGQTPLLLSAKLGSIH